MIGALFIIQALILLGIEVILWQTQTIMATQAEEAKALSDIGDQLDKAIGELTTALGNLDKTSPEVDAATQRLQKVSQALDDMNPDTPPNP